MIKCKNCKWYVALNTFKGTPMTCNCPKIIYGYGNGPPGLDEVMIEYDEGWGMLPGPEFGCVHGTAP